MKLLIAGVFGFLLTFGEAAGQTSPTADQINVGETAIQETAVVFEPTIFLAELEAICSLRDQNWVAKVTGNAAYVMGHNAHTAMTKAGFNGSELPPQLANYMLSQLMPSIIAADNTNKAACAIFNSTIIGIMDDAAYGKMLPK